MLKINGVVGILLALTALAPTKAIAACSTYPYTFTNGTTADANQMMSNLNYVGGCAAPIANPSFTGTVGIGTTAPGYALDIFGTSGAQLRTNSTGSNRAAILVNDVAGGQQAMFEMDDANTPKWQFGKNTDNSFFFYDNVNGHNFITVGTTGTATFGEASNQLALPITGGVGIGTFSPGFALDVYGTSIAQLRTNSTGANRAAILVNDVAGGQQAIFEMDDAYNAKWQFGKQTDNSFFFYDNTNNHNFITIGTTGSSTFGEASNQLVLPAGGNVGIGTTSPAATLDVAGYARLKLNSSQPVACGSSNEGSIALTHTAQVCVCSGATPSWYLLNTSTACSW